MSIVGPRYPDLLENPDGDPRIYQEQYEDWVKWEKEHGYREPDATEEE